MFTILYMRKYRFREAEGHAQGGTARKRQSQNLNSSALDAKTHTFDLCVGHDGASAACMPHHHCRKQMKKWVGHMKQLFQTLESRQ